MVKNIIDYEDLIDLKSNKGFCIKESEKENVVNIETETGIFLFELLFDITEQEDTLEAIEKLKFLGFEIEYKTISEEERKKIENERTMKKYGVDIKELRKNVEENEEWYLNPYTAVGIKKDLPIRTSMLFHTYYLHEKNHSKIGLEFLGLRTATTRYQRDFYPVIPLTVKIYEEKNMSLIRLKVEDKKLFILKDNDCKEDTPFIICIELENIMPKNLEKIISTVMKNTNKFFKKYKKKDENIYECVPKKFEGYSSEIDNLDLDILKKIKFDKTNKIFKENNARDFKCETDLPKIFPIRILKEKEIISQRKQVNKKCK